MELGVCAAYARARALGELEALRQCLRVEGRRLGSQGGERGLRWVLRGGLDHAVQAAQHAVDAQLRASGHGRHEPAHPGQRGAAALVPQTAQTVRSQTPTQAVQQGLAEGGGALLRGRSALEGEGGATAGQTTREQLLEDRIFMHDRIHCLCT